MKKAIVLITASIALIMLLTSCQAPTNVSGVVTYNFDVSEIVAQGYDVTRVLVKMTHTSGEKLEVELEVGDDGVARGRVDNLLIGTWYIEVEVYENETLIATGSALSEVKAGEITDVIITAQPTTGGVEITIILGDEPQDVEGLTMSMDPEYVEFDPHDGWRFYWCVTNVSTETIRLYELKTYYARSENSDFQFMSSYNLSNELQPGTSFNPMTTIGPRSCPGYQWKYVVYGVGSTTKLLYKAEGIVTLENPMLSVILDENSFEVPSQEYQLSIPVRLRSCVSTPITLLEIEEYVIELGENDYELSKTYNDDEIIGTLGTNIIDSYSEKTLTFNYDSVPGKRLKYVFHAQIGDTEIVRECELQISIRSREYDTWDLRINADFEVEVASNVWWIPANELGGTDYTNEQIAQIAQNDTPEQKKEEIDTLYEAIQLYQISVFESTNDNIHYTDPETGKSWEYHKPGYHSVRTNAGCCAASTSWLYYILEDDYEELGFIEYANHYGGGHVFNYIKHNGWYYIIDMTHHRVDMVENGAAPIESGNMEDFNSSDRTLGPIFKVANLQDYANYLANLSSDIGLILSYTLVSPESLPIGSYTDENGNRVRAYPSYMEGKIEILYDDTEDSLVIGYSATPDYYPDWGSIPTAEIDPQLPPWPFF